MKILALVVLAAACGTLEDRITAGGAGQIVANPDRTEHDHKLDAGRKPVEMLTFFALTPGDARRDSVPAVAIRPSDARSSAERRGVRPGHAETGRGRAHKVWTSATRATGAGEHEALHAPVG